MYTTIIEIGAQRPQRSLFAQPTLEIYQGVTKEVWQFKFQLLFKLTLVLASLMNFALFNYYLKCRIYTICHLYTLGLQNIVLHLVILGSR